MDFLKFFTREEAIAGLEISDAAVRLALLKIKVESRKETGNKKGEIEFGKEKIDLKDEANAGVVKTEEKKKPAKQEVVVLETLIEKELPAGVIVGGEVKDAVVLGKVIGEALKEAKEKIRYVVLSIFDEGVYDRVYSFPKTVQAKKLEEAMKLTVGFQLPIKTDDVYLDWEKIDGSTSSPQGDGKDNNEIFLAAANKQLISGYLNVLQAVGLTPVSIETSSASISRAADFLEGAHILFLNCGREGADAFFIEDGAVRFSRFIPAEFFPDAEVFADEIRKLIDFYESENKVSVAGVSVVGGELWAGKLASGLEKRLFTPVVDAKPMKIFSGYANLTEKGKQAGQWLAVLGAAMRGIVPRAEDTIVSLMPLGTEEAYENRKAIIFSEFLSNLTIGLAIFFAAVFAGAWLLTVFVQQSLGQRASVLQTTTLSVSDGLSRQGGEDLESRALAFNVAMGKARTALAETPRWSRVVEELKSRVIPGIIINSVNVGSVSDAITVSGNAQNRAQLNLFKKALDESSRFSEAIIPLTNLEKRDSIPFTASFKIKDLEWVYQE